MEVFRTVMLNVIVLAFFTTLLDLLLPNSTFRSYIKMAMGFFVVLTLLQPILQFLQKDHIISIAQSMAKTEQMAIAESVASEPQTDFSTFYDAQTYRRQVETQYAEQIAKQIEALLLLSNDIVAQVQCFFVDKAEQEGTRQMQVAIQIADTNATLDRIKSAVCGYYGFDPAQVEVTVVSEEEKRDDKYAE